MCLSRASRPISMAFVLVFSMLRPSDVGPSSCVIPAQFLQDEFFLHLLSHSGNSKALAHLIFKAFASLFFPAILIHSPIGIAGR